MTKRQSWFSGITKSKMESLERKAKAYDSLMDKEAMTPFVEEFVKNLGTLAALTPYEQWTNQMKVCAMHAKEKCPFGWEVYKKNLPK